jgi:hypothetical protein
VARQSCTTGRAGGMKDVNRSKRLVHLPPPTGGATARTCRVDRGAAPPLGASGWTSRIVAASRPTVDTESPRAQKCCPVTCCRFPRDAPRNVDSALPLHEADDLGDRVFRGNGEPPGDMGQLEVPLLHRCLALLGQVASHRAPGLPQLAVQGLAPILGNPHHMGPCTPTECGLRARCRPWKPPGTA